MPHFPTDTVTLLHSPQPPAATRRGMNDTTGRKNMQQLIELRWIAALGQFATILVVHFGFEIPLPLKPMLWLLGGLVLFNAVSVLRLRTHPEVTNAELLVAVLVDVAMLTGQLYLSGGATNPFVFLYLLQVTLAAVLLEAWSTWTIVAITGACFAGLALFGRPLALPLDHDRGLWSPYIQGMLLCFALNAALLVVFISRISANLRARDARLADLRQRAAEEEHIVRMGLLASGAAHELGTPLATLSVILGDWAHLPSFTSEPDMLQEIEEMQAQVLRCKSIVSGILLSAGEARGDSPSETTMRTFLDDLVDEWKVTRSVSSVDYRNRFGGDLRIVSDSAIKQMVCNVLDNALEASPTWVGLEATRDEDTLRLTVTDRGPGFAPGILQRLGTPYQSTKGRPGGGLGLFLVVNVARTLGGSVDAGNRAEGGAFVTVTLPLAAITLDEEEEGIDAD
ncbi:two-component sensor histidine kinase [Pigmentiphaga litoralis]|jgi:two-component system sensor histidine kinase RegB|uniref:ATP-binding protein n=1 Tax=Pigmentiphaga litoralis TaxID=516702 RepID=UPI0016746158|nr:two-component sensor histidine kinase [Pigmentiphaga litoralis]